MQKGDMLSNLNSKTLESLFLIVRMACVGITESV